MDNRGYSFRPFLCSSLWACFCLVLPASCFGADIKQTQAVRQVLSALPEIDGESPEDIPAELRDYLVAGQPQAGSELLSIIRKPDNPLHRRATNALLQIWQSLSPEQIETYFRLSMTAYVSARPTYPQGLAAYVGAGYRIRYGWGGWPRVEGIKMLTSSQKYLDGQAYGDAFRYNGHQASAGGLKIDKLLPGKHTAQIITAYTISHRDNTYTGKVASDVVSFQIVGTKHARNLAAPDDPSLTASVHGAFRISEVRDPNDRDSVLGGFSGYLWKPQNSAYRRGDPDEFAVHMPIYSLTKALPVDLCFDVDVIVGQTGQVYKGEPFVIEKGRKGELGYFGLDSTDMFDFVQTHQGFVPVRIRLTPSRTRAFSDRRVKKYFPGTLTSQPLRVKSYWFRYDHAQPWERDLKDMYDDYQGLKKTNRGCYYRALSLTSLNPYRRNRGARGMDLMPPDEAKDYAPIVACLIKLLGHTDTDLNAETSLFAEGALVRVGPFRIELLVQALQGVDPAMRELVAGILGRIDHPRATEALIDCLTDPEDTVRVTVTSALGNTPDVRAIAPLTRALHDSNKQVRKAATVALEKVQYGLKLRRNLDATVRFSDPNLENAIRSSIKSRKRSLTGGDLVGVGLTYLSLFKEQIKSLEGLEYCTDLAVLHLNENQIEDIGAVSDLRKLKELYLIRNMVKDVSAIKPLIEMKRLGLSANQIVDLLPLSGLDQLRALDLGENEIQVISPLGNLTRLTSLRLDRNRISDISALAQMSEMKDLRLGSNQIGDITPLQKMIQLQVLELEFNEVTDLSPLEKLGDLYSLRLSSNPLGDIRILAGLENLRFLDLYNCRISDISPLASLKHLQRLNLSDNNISDIGCLVNNKYIAKGTTIYLQRNPLNRESQTVHIPALREREVSLIWEPPRAKTIHQQQLSHPSNRIH